MKSGLLISTKLLILEQYGTMLATCLLVVSKQESMLKKNMRKLQTKNMSC